MTAASPSPSSPESINALNYSSLAFSSNLSPKKYNGEIARGKWKEGEREVTFVKIEKGITSFIFPSESSSGDSGSTSEEKRIDFRIDLIDKLLFLTRLEIISNGLTTIPAEITALSNLKILNLSSNQITTIPAKITLLVHLEIFNLSANALDNSCWLVANLLEAVTASFWTSSSREVIPPEIGSLSNLKELNLSNNRICSLPREFSSLRMLEKLDLSGNILESIPLAICHLPHLQFLNLKKNQLQTKVISTLSLSGYIYTESVPIPPGFERLNYLKKLDLSHNKLTQLPDEIGGLTNLESLFLNNNQLISISQKISLLNSLCSLNLAQNELEEFPGEIAFLSDLQKLDISGNNLKSLPERLFYLQNLKEITLSKNNLNESSFRFRDDVKVIR